MAECCFQAVTVLCNISLGFYCGLIWNVTVYTHASLKCQIDTFVKDWIMWDYGMSEISVTKNI